MKIPPWGTEPRAPPGGHWRPHRERSSASFRKCVWDQGCLGRSLLILIIVYHYVLIINNTYTFSSSFCNQTFPLKRPHFNSCELLTPALMLKWQEILRQFIRKLKANQREWALFSVICRAAFVNWSPVARTGPQVYLAHSAFCFYISVGCQNLKLERFQIRLWILDFFWKIWALLGLSFPWEVTGLKLSGTCPL